MNLFDLLLVAVLAYCLIRGIFRGLVKELSSIVGVLGGLYAAYTYYAVLSDLLARWITHSANRHIISCLVLFFGVYFIISIVGVMIKHLMNIVFIGWTDRICGAFFGAVKGVLIGAVLILVLTTFLPKNTAILRDSHAARYVMRISATMANMASKDIQSLFSAKAKELNKAWRAKKI